jgi:hypothetical protein
MDSDVMEEGILCDVQDPSNSTCRSDKRRDGTNPSIIYGPKPSSEEIPDETTAPKPRKERYGVGVRVIVGVGSVNGRCV